MREPIKTMACDNVDEFIYGTCAKPLTTKSGLVIGGGEIYPELNFTLPAMQINKSTIKEAYEIYTDIITESMKRAYELGATGVTVEFETLPEFTENPKWGLEVTKILQNTMKEYEAKHGMKTALRVTPNDMREMNRPPIMRSGKYWESMKEFFKGCGELDVDYISIESTGGKELCDEGLVQANIRRTLFALGVPCATDMQFLWEEIISTCKEYGIVAAGDSSCGFANTAMVLAEGGFIPRTFAAVVRNMTISRALIPYEMGATGPSKDCEYVGGYLKAITGYPVSMEGRMAAGAHLSQVGNIAAAVPDLWSNESIQQVQLLSGMAPVVGMEQLIFDCRMLNTAKKMGQGLAMRDILVESDAPHDVQAYILRPDVIIDIASEIITETDPYLRTKKAALVTIDRLRKAIDAGKVECPERDEAWLDIMEDQIGDCPDDPIAFYDEIKSELDMKKFIPSEYELA